MSTQYPVLGSPLQVNGITLKNRMITTSMSPGAGYVTKDNRPTQRLANYLEERAEGQTALIIQTSARGSATTSIPITSTSFPAATTKAASPTCSAT